MSLKKECEVSWNKLLFALVHRTLLVSYMASQENVVIKAAVEVFLQATSHFGTNSASRIPYELPLGHLVLDVRRAEVDREEDQGEAHHVYGVNGHGQRWVALAEANLLVIIILFLI
jgi:hypothetical protein